MTNFNNNLLLSNEAAKDIFSEIETSPVYDMHTHVDLKMILDNGNASDPWEALCKGDHYVASIMESLGAMDRESFFSEKTDPFDKWKAYAQIFPKLLGNQIQDWMRLTLIELGVEIPFNEENAKTIWDELSIILKSERWKPVNLFKNTNIQMMSTTDNPVDPLDQIERSKEHFPKNYWLPSWRPDPFFNLLPGMIKAKIWIEWVNDLEKVTDQSIKGSFQNFLNALGIRHDYFSQNGCRASDYGITIPYGHDISPERAESIYQKACLEQPINTDEAADFQSFMMRFSMGLDFEKGWISQIHYGAVRNMRDIAKTLGGLDSGCDTIGGYIDVAKSLRPLLNHFDNAGVKQHKIFLYTLDKTDWMKITGLSRIFPSVYTGISWWYFDSVSGMMEFMRTVPDAGAGLTKTGPFVTDARNIYSLVPRSQVFRRCLSSVLGEFIENRGNRLDEAIELGKYLCSTHVKKLVGIR